MSVLFLPKSEKSDPTMGAYRTPEVGSFHYFPKYSFIVAFISQLKQKPQQWSIFEVIENILPFVLNTKRRLSDICLLRYVQNSFGCFRKQAQNLCRSCVSWTKSNIIIITQRKKTGPNYALWGHMGPNMTIHDQTGPYWSMQDHTGPNVTIYEPKGPYRTIQGFMGPYGAS